MANALAVARTPVAWTSDASGNAAVSVPGLNGMIIAVEFVPGRGAVQPTNNYSAILANASGYDLLLGKASANLSNAAVSRLIPAASTSDTNTLSGVAVGDETCVLAISGAGNAKSGTVIIYTR
jgi:hypothetical protein